jgi:predicted O-methyltransferase YrrM
MKFDEVLELLRSYRTPQGEVVLFLLQPQTMEDIYNCVLHSSARDCLELGTGYGATTCVIAAALDETGGGRVTTIDMVARDPIGVDILAQHTGLSSYIEAITDVAGYNWYIGEAIARQTVNGMCVPCFDFCFLDGAHEWGTDALAVFLVAKLLRAGAWIVLDDLDFKLRGCQPGWEVAFRSRTEKELDAQQVSMVFDFVLRPHPDFSNFTVSDGGRTGWARKVGGRDVTWQPTGHVLDPDSYEWSESFSAAQVTQASGDTAGIAVSVSGDSAMIRAAHSDPNFVIFHFVDIGWPIDCVVLRLRLLEPGTETLQVFWIEGDAQFFSEAQSARVRIAATDDLQEVTVRINSWRPAGLIRGLRLDLTDGPSSLLLESLTIGGSRRVKSE